MNIACAEEKAYKKVSPISIHEGKEEKTGEEISGLCHDHQDDGICNYFPPTRSLCHASYAAFFLIA